MNHGQFTAGRHEQARQEILRIKDRLPASVILNFFARRFPSWITEKSPGFWLLQIILMNLVIITPGVVLAVALREIYRWPPHVYIWFAAVELSIYAFILAYTVIRVTYYDSTLSFLN